MKANKNRTIVITGATTAILGMALTGLVSCSSGESTSNTVAPGGSAGLQGPMVFVNNTATSTLTSVALKGDSGNAVVNTIPSADFEGVALGDMQLSDGDWVFVNLGAAGKVAAIDPKTAATPFRKLNVPTGTRPVHLYRDPNDGEVIWIMNDGHNAPGTTTPGDDLVNCNNPLRVGGPLVGGSVTAVHNSHFGPGGVDPVALGTVCVLADGHKVAAFSSGLGVPKRVFVSSEDAGEIAVIDDDELSPTYGDMIARIDLCKDAKEATPCDDESLTGPTTAFTPNASAPHGIRWSKLTKKIYSIQEGYGEIAEIDPTTYVVTPIFDLAGLPYTSYGISPNGRFLLLRGDTTPATGTKLGVIDLGTAGNPVTHFNVPELAGTSPGSFKFSPDSNRFYILAGNAATATKKNQLFAFDSSTLAAATPALTLLREIPLVATGAHSFDILAQTPTGAPVGTPGEAKYIVVSNGIDNSLSFINATDNQIKQTVQNVGPTVGSILGGVMVFAPGTASAGNQASS